MSERNLSYPWSIPGADGQAILGDTHYPYRTHYSGEMEIRYPEEMIGRLILSHGFKGYKDYGFFPHLANAAATKGLVTRRFNFSHSGITNRVETFERPDLFERDTFGKQIEDLRLVDRKTRYLSHIDSEELRYSDRFDYNTDVGFPAEGRPVIWFGHSRGGITSLLLAARAFEPSFYSATKPEPWETRPPDALIIAASPHVSSYLTEEQRDQLRRDGYLETASTRTKQTLRIGRAWLEELEAQPDQFDPLLAASFIKCPALFIHGDADQTVDVESSRLLAEAAAPHARLEIIPGGNHTFNCPNPYSLDREPPELTKRFIDLVCDFAVEQATRAK